MLLVILGVIVWLQRQALIALLMSPTPSPVPNGIMVNDNQLLIEGDRPQIETVAENLNIPWEIAILPDGQILVTERSGSIILVEPVKNEIGQIEEVAHAGEGGLLGMALHPNFSINRWLYIYLTSRDGNELVNRVERYKYEDGSLSEKIIILEGILGAANHDGGRIAFGPDGYLYITTGDAQEVDLAQDTNSLNGKILRINDDGSIPPDNPFENAVWAYGLRNPQGITWDEQGRLWATDHGPSGLESGCDELNLIEKGKNYGWPDVRCDESAVGMTDPVIQSGRDDTWAPAGITFYRGSLFFTGLRGSALYQAALDGTSVVELKAHFKSEFGRLRGLVLGPDDYLYLTSSNTDGRGNPDENDDKLIRIDANIFFD